MCWVGVGADMAVTKVIFAHCEPDFVPFVGGILHLPGSITMSKFCCRNGFGQELCDTFYSEQKKKEPSGSRPAFQKSPAYWVLSSVEKLCIPT